MTFGTYELSRDDGAPASLFLIQWGDNAASYFAYTDSDVEITFDSITYVPTVIGRQKIVSGGTPDGKTLEIDITPNSSLAQMYAQSPPSQKVGIIIRQGHVWDPDNDFNVVWSGVVQNVNWGDGGLAKIVARPLDALLAMPGLRRHYMYGCPLVLYDGLTCKADKTVHQRVLTPVALGSNYVGFSPGWNGATAAQKYLGGYMQWTDSDGNLQTRTNINFGADTNEIIVGNTLKMTLSSSITVYAGCGRTMDDCLNLHDNIVNFGGQPYIPSDNPVSYVNRFY